MLLLALDDELKIGEFVGRVARKVGIDAEVTTSVSDFRGQYEGRAPDVVVLDLHIGKNDGLSISFVAQKPELFDPVLLADVQVENDDIGGAALILSSEIRNRRRHLNVDSELRRHAPDELTNFQFVI